MMNFIKTTLVGVTVDDVRGSVEVRQVSPERDQAAAEARQ